MNMTILHRILIAALVLNLCIGYQLLMYRNTVKILTNDNKLSNSHFDNDKQRNQNPRFTPKSSLSMMISNNKLYKFPNIYSNMNSNRNKKQPFLSSSQSTIRQYMTLTVSAIDFIKTKLKGNLIGSWNLPNLLSVFRVIMIPIFLLSFVFEKRNFGVALFVLASLTDLVDGYLARKWKQTSDFGAFLDPVADKLMVASALSLLVCNLPVWWFAIPVALVLCREIGVSALREWMSSKGMRDIVQVGKLGKWKTALQMISITLLLFSSNPTLDSAGNAVVSSRDLDDVGLIQSLLLSAGLLGFYISTALTLISGYQYFKAAWPKLQPSGDNSNSNSIPEI